MYYLSVKIKRGNTFSMKPSQEYVKKILEILQSWDEPYMKIGEFGQFDIDINSKEFRHHIEQLIYDEQLITFRVHVERLYTGSADGKYLQCNGSADLRLTSDGHKLAEAMNTPEVWEVIKSEAKHDAIGTMRRVAVQLFEGVVKSNTERLLKGMKKHGTGEQDPSSES